MKPLSAILLVLFAAASGQALARDRGADERGFWRPYAQEQRERGPRQREYSREERRDRGMRRDEGDRGQEQRRDGRMSPEERRQLREDLRQHGHDIYPSRRGQGEGGRQRGRER